MTVRHIVREDYTSQPDTVRIDPEKGEAYDVKILGWESRNGATYNPIACSSAESLRCYEGAVSNIDHLPASSTPTSQSFASRFGRVHEPYAKEDGIYAKRYKYNVAHPLAKTFEYWCQNDPGAIGFSQVADCRIDPKQRGPTRYEGIARVFSVDLVANPATTKGVYESEMEPVAPEASDYTAQIGALVSSIATDANLSVAEKKKKIMAALKLTDDAPEKPEGDTPDPVAESLRAEVATLKAQLDTVRVKEALIERNAKVRKLCLDAGLVAQYITDTFVSNLVDMTDDTKVQRAIEDRRDVLRGDNKPTSAGQTPPTLSYDSFILSVKGK